MLKQDPKDYKKILLKLAVSFTLLTIILLSVDKEVLLNNLSKVNLWYVPLIILLIILNYVVSSFRWKQLLIFEKSEKATLQYLINLYFIGSFFNNLMPTSIGGDVYKVVKLGKKIDSNVNAFSATFMERFTGVLVLILISLVSMYNLIGVYVFPIIFLFILGICLGLLVSKFLGKKFKFFTKIYDSLSVYKNSKNIVVTALLSSLVVQLIAILTQYFVFASLGVSIPLMYAMLVLPFITLAGFFVPSLNGIGVQDALYISMFSFVGIPAEICLSASILYHMFRMFVSLIGGVLYAMGKAE